MNVLIGSRDNHTFPPASPERLAMAGRHGNHACLCAACLRTGTHRRARRQGTPRQRVVPF
ncbi:MAG: hypothetical protein JRJ70_04005 [Deltaproteobacteria bacterium]|nr:hypothetical protein [Deltaproteobacteria bacterium]